MSGSFIQSMPTRPSSRVRATEQLHRRETALPGVLPHHPDAGRRRQPHQVADRGSRRPRRCPGPGASIQVLDTTVPGCAATTGSWRAQSSPCWRVCRRSPREAPESEPSAAAATSPGRTPQDGCSTWSCVVAPKAAR